MQLNLFGFDLTTAAEIAKIAGPVAVVGGIAWRYGNGLYNRLLNREFDQWLVSVTSVTAADEGGYRHLMLDNLGSPERFDDAVRGRDERAWMRRAANHCSWEPERRFLLADEDHGRAILHVVRNALTKYWQDGVRAKIAGKNVTVQQIYFAVTGADAAVGAKKKFRVIVMTEADMRTILDHPAGKWRFDDETHRVRLETCRIMARAWEYDSSLVSLEKDAAQRHPVVAGTNVVDGEHHAIVGWMRVYDAA
jgi:hypothetical protein